MKKLIICICFFSGMSFIYSQPAFFFHNKNIKEWYITAKKEKLQEEINKINIEIGSIKDNSAVEEFNSLLGYQVQDEKFGVVTVRSYSDRLGEKVLVCENEDESLRFILTKEQLLLGDLSSFGIPPVILEKPLDFKVDNVFCAAKPVTTVITPAEAIILRPNFFPISNVSNMAAKAISEIKKIAIFFKICTFV